MGKFKPPQLAPRPGGLKSNIEEHPVARPQDLEKCSTGHSASLENGSKDRTPLTEISGRSAGSAGSQFYKILYSKRNANKVLSPFLHKSHKKDNVHWRTIGTAWLIKSNCLATGSAPWDRHTWQMNLEHVPALLQWCTISKKLPNSQIHSRWTYVPLSGVVF